MMKTRIKEHITCNSSRRVTAGLLLCSLFLGGIHSSYSTRVPEQAIIAPPSNHDERPLATHERFTLRQIFHHGVYDNPGLHIKKDIPPSSNVHMLLEDERTEVLPELYIQSEPITMQRLRERRPSTIDAMLLARRVSKNNIDILADAWTIENTPGPNITDKETVLALGYMTYDAYYIDEHDSEWHDVGDSYNRSLGIGWEKNGLRGHIWTNEDNSTVVIGLKGTTPGYWDSDSDTTRNDKTNDNLFGSCCCGQQGPILAGWKQVCDCATGTYTCNQTCLVENLQEPSRYFTASQELFRNVSSLYPTSNIWAAGHSLGGLVSSLLGQTYGIPAVSFEAVPDALASKRLGLPKPPKHDRNLTGSFQIGHTADPVYMGSCGGYSSCSIAGFAFEAQCHTGRRCVYDTVKDMNIGANIWRHRMVWVIENVLKFYNEIPPCVVDDECVDCYNWNFIESHNRTTSTSSLPTSTKSERTRTRTEMCRTPGWWGCLDSTTRTTSTGLVTTTTTSSYSCVTRGWFGCLDDTTSEPTTKTKTTDTTSTMTTTCLDPGRFWGCNDPVPTTAFSAAGPPLAVVTQTKSPARLDGDEFNDDWRTTHTAMITEAPRYGG